MKKQSKRSQTKEQKLTKESGTGKVVFTQDNSFKKFNAYNADARKRKEGMTWQVY